MRLIYRALAAGVLGAGGVAAYAFLVEPRWLQVTYTRVPLRGLPPALAGLRIALLTDMHLGRGTPRSLIRRACRAAMAAAPHLIAVTGDFVNAHAADPQQGVDALYGLAAPLGVYAVPGNHDHEQGIEAWHRAVARYAGMIDLTNRAERRTWNGQPLVIAGVDDLNTGEPHLPWLAADAAPALTLLLAHNPEYAERLCEGAPHVDLILSGHTHGGQVRLPLFGPLQTSVRRDDLYEAGLVRRPWTQVYISRGIGTVHLPVRFLTRPEVAILELVPEAEARG